MNTTGSSGVGAAAVGLILAVILQFGWREISKWQDWIILIPAFVLVGIFHISRAGAGAARTDRDPTQPGRALFQDR